MIKLQQQQQYNSWVLANMGDSAKFWLNMHPDLADPIEQLGIEIEPDANETVTDFKDRFGERLLWNNGINVTDLEELDLRCGGSVIETNMSRPVKLSEDISKCMIQKCRFIQNGPEICPPDYKETDDRIFWIYFLLRYVVHIFLHVFFKKYIFLP